MKARLPILLAISALGFSACSDRMAGGGSETEYLTLEGAAELPSGAPAKGARVSVRPSEYYSGEEGRGNRALRDTVLDDAGAFRLEDLPAGDYAVEIVADDTLGLLARVALGSGPAPRISGALAPMGRLRASILAPDPGVAYILRVRGLERVAVADGQGNLQVTLPPGEGAVRLSASLPGGRILEFSRLDIRAGGDTALAPVPAAAFRPSAPVPVLFDCNIGFAADDAGGLATLHALASLGEARILAVGTSQASRKSAAVLDVINTYYGRPDLPVGAWKREIPAGSAGYDSALVSEFPQDLPGWDSLPEAAALYRKALAGLPDSQAVLVVTGGLHNAWDLLRLDRDLVARKVRHLVVTGGVYPSGKEFNFTLSVARDTLPNLVQEVVQLWPTPVIYHGWEAALSVQTGSCLAQFSGSPGNPVRRIYDLALGGPGRATGSWDLAPVLFAVRGAAENWNLVSEGSNSIAADGSNQWNPVPDSDHGYLVRRAEADVLAAELDSLLCRVPSL